MESNRYVCKLTPELLERATNELHEPTTDEERWAAIDQLKNAFNEDKHGKLIRSDDLFFLKFLRAKKFDQKKALTVLENYHKLRSDYKLIFDKVNNPILLKPMIEKSILYMLPGRANDGSAVMFYRPGLLDKDCDIYDLMAYSCLSFEKLLEDESVQICGLSTVEDMKGFNIAIIFKISVRELGKMNSVWMDAMPMRFRAAHILNEGKIYDALMMLFKPFLKQKILDRIKLHGSKFSKLHEFIDPSLLPPYLDGSGRCPEEAAKEWNDLLSADLSEDTAL